MIYKNDIFNRLTIIIPMYNEEKRLDYSFQKWLKNGFIGHINLILVDDGSNDSTYSKALNLCSDNINISVFSFAHKSKFSAIHKSLIYVKTPYVLCIDADTWFGEPIENFAKEFERLIKIDTDLITFKLEPCSENANLVTKFQLVEYTFYTDILPRIFGIIGNVNGAAALWKTNFLVKVLEKHSLFFEGDDLEATLIAHQLHGKLNFSSFCFKKQAKQTFIELIKQRIKIWDVGLFRVFSKKQLFINIPINIDTLFLKWYAIFEVFLHPMKIFNFFLILISFLIPSYFNNFNIFFKNFSNFVTSSYIAIVIYCFFLWIISFKELKQTYSILFMLVTFLIYPALNLITGSIKVGFILSLIFWGIISFIYSFLISTYTIRCESLKISLFMPLYFIFMSVIVRSFGLIFWLKNILFKKGYLTDYRNATIPINLRNK